MNLEEKNKESIIKRIDREKLLAKSKEYYNGHRQEISERNKKYRQDNLEKVRKYEREKARRYYYANKEKK